MKNFQFSVSVLGKTLNFTLRSVVEDDETLYYISSEEIDFDHPFDAEDLLDFISSGGFMDTVVDQITRENKNSLIQIRTDTETRKIISQKAVQRGKSVSKFLRELALEA